MVGNSTTTNNYDLILRCDLFGWKIKSWRVGCVRSTVEWNRIDWWNSWNWRIYISQIYSCRCKQTWPFTTNNGPFGYVLLNLAVSSNWAFRYRSNNSVTKYFWNGLDVIEEDSDISESAEKLCSEKFEDLIASEISDKRLETCFCQIKTDHQLITYL